MDEILQLISPMKIRIKETEILKFYEITQDPRDQYIIKNTSSKSWTRRENEENRMRTTKIREDENKKDSI